jgi:hypothetical protein
MDFVRCAFGLFYEAVLLADKSVSRLLFEKPEIANGREISRIREFYIYDLHMLIGQELPNFFLAKTMHFHA